MGKAAESKGAGRTDTFWPFSDKEGFPPPLPLRDPLVWGVFLWSFFLSYMCGTAGAIWGRLVEARAGLLETPLTCAMVVVVERLWTS